MSTIRSVMQTKLVTVRPGDSIRHAIELLIEHHISGLPVVEADGTIAGVLSEKDVLKVFYDDGYTVASLMTASPQTVSANAELVEVVDILMANDFRRVLVHEGGKLVGIVSRADLMPAILDSLLAHASQPPPSP